MTIDAVFRNTIHVIPREGGESSNHRTTWVDRLPDRTDGDYWMPAFAGMTTRRRSLQRPDLPAGVTNAGLTCEARNDGVEFLRFDRLADQGRHDFGGVTGQIG
jgi:hypothetical protein